MIFTIHFGGLPPLFLGKATHFVLGAHPCQPPRYPGHTMQAERTLQQIQEILGAPVPWFMGI